MNELKELLKLIEGLVTQVSTIAGALKKVSQNEENMLKYIDILETRIRALENANKN